MQRFANKATAERRTYSVGFGQDLDEDDHILTAAVTAAVYQHSEVADDSPSAILNGAASVNLAAITIKDQEVLARQAILQSITGGVVGCTYVLTFSATLASGEGPLIEQVLLTISRYVPTP